MDVEFCPKDGEKKPDPVKDLQRALADLDRLNNEVRDLRDKIPVAGELLTVTTAQSLVDDRLASRLAELRGPMLEELRKDLDLKPAETPPAAAVPVVDVARPKGFFEDPVGWLKAN